MSKELDEVMTREEFKAMAQELLTPIDFDALIKAGVLEKRGAWYRVLKMDELPTHALRKVKVVKLSEKVPLMKFYRPSKKLAEIVKNI